MKRTVILAALMLSGCATSYALAPADMTTVRYSNGNAISVSTKALGTVLITPGGRAFEGRMTFAIGVTNNGSVPANVGPENVHVTTSSGRSLRVFTVTQLESEAVRQARAASFAAAMSAAGQSMSAAQPTTAYSTGSVYGTGGYANYSSATSVYNPAATAAAQARIQGQESRQLAGIAARRDAAIASYERYLLKTTTLDPSQKVLGTVVVERPEFNSNELKAVRVMVDFAGEQHQFEFNVVAP